MKSEKCILSLQLKGREFVTKFRSYTAVFEDDPRLLLPLVAPNCWDYRYVPEHSRFLTQNRMKILSGTIFDTSQVIIMWANQ